MQSIAQDTSVSVMTPYSDSIPRVINQVLEPDWYKRPIVVDITQLATSGAITKNLDFTTIWLTDPLVNRHLKSVRMIRPNFKIKIHCTSSPIMYGPILCVMAYGGQVSAITYTNSHYLDHAIISPCGTNECVMTVPWSHPLDYYTLNNGGTTINRTLLDNSGDILGSNPKLRILSYGNIRSTATTFPGLSITVTVWCDSCEMAQVYVPQSGKDEYTKPTISKAATTLAGEIDKVKVPVIQPFLTGTSMALKLGSSIASIFGFSRPINIEVAQPVVSSKYGDQYSLNSQRTGRRLVDDIKQEVVLTDPSVGNSYGVDELSFDRLVDSWTIIHHGDVTVPSNGGQLAWFPVTPCVTSTAGVAGWYQMSPMTLTALSFRRWRGDMRFKIRIDTTVYHSGVIQVMWDPMFRTGTITSTNMSEQLLIDVNGTKEIEFVVPYSNALPMLNTRQYDIATTQLNAVADNPQQYFNGAIRINVYSPIGGTGNFPMTIFCKGEPGFMFDTLSDFASKARFNNSTNVVTTNPVVPTVPRIQQSYQTGDLFDVSNTYTPQSGVLPETKSDGTVLGPHFDTNNVTSTVVGQGFKSMRPYLKRNSPLIRWKVVATAADRVVIDLPQCPILPVRNDGIAKNCYYSTGNLIGLFSAAFLGYRGSMRYSVAPSTIADEATVFTWPSGFVSNPAQNCNKFPTIGGLADVDAWNAARGQCFNYNHGVQHFAATEEISFEIPYRSNVNFVHTRQVGSVYTNSGPVPIDYPALPSATLMYRCEARVAIDSSVGEDFNLFIRILVPPVSIKFNTTNEQQVTYTGTTPVVAQVNNPPGQGNPPAPAPPVAGAPDDIIDQVVATDELNPDADPFVPESATTVS